VTPLFTTSSLSLVVSWSARKVSSKNEPKHTSPKLCGFKDLGLGVISIRGTSNNWDMLADSQLWSAAALMQGI
jgi:hypothetical protein